MIVYAYFVPLELRSENDELEFGMGLKDVAHFGVSLLGGVALAAEPLIAIRHELSTNASNAH